MTGIEQGLLIGGLMILLLALRVHIGGAMLIAGSIGYFWVAGATLAMQGTRRDTRSMSVIVKSTPAS